MTSTPLAREVDSLTRRMLSDGVQSQEDKGYITIYKHICNDIIPLVDPGTDFPPLPVLAYVLREHVREIFPNEVPATLDLLAHIESMRRRFAQQLTEVLEVNGRLQSEPDPLSIPLTTGERVKIKEFRSSVGRKLRKTYREIVVGLSLHHAYEAWVSHEDIEPLCATYFPFQGTPHSDPLPPSDIEKQHSFHAHLTGDERKELQTMGSVFWELPERFKSDGMDMGPSKPSQEKMRATYRRPKEADPAHLAKLTTEYLDKFQNAVATVEDILATVED
ncbi:hypothetical protein PsYK624_076220 [Phanerochaete sordida]|uniref:Uncharacterized protein n=1 Tax=Phanerochaete sordida TaxID=48140 RepID=A0A9P3GBA1_9APHY|nr:hypothetical protein PsYK624_076220 [Phanerochaete sordida]